MRVLPSEPRLLSQIKEFAGFPQAKCPQSAAVSIGDFGAGAARRHQHDRFCHYQLKSGTKWFYSAEPRPYKVGAQSPQLADAGNARHVCDQLDSGATPG